MHNLGTGTTVQYYINKTIILSLLFVATASGQRSWVSEYLSNQTKALRIRAYFKAQLDMGEMVSSSVALQLRTGVYFLRGNEYLPAEIYHVQLQKTSALIQK